MNGVGSRPDKTSTQPSSGGVDLEEGEIASDSDDDVVLIPECSTSLVTRSSEDESLEFRVLLIGDERSEKFHLPNCSYFSAEDVRCLPSADLSAVCVLVEQTLEKALPDNYNVVVIFALHYDLVTVCQVNGARIPRLNEYFHFGSLLQKIKICSHDWKRKYPRTAFIWTIPYPPDFAEYQYIFRKGKVSHDGEVDEKTWKYTRSYFKRTLEIMDKWPSECRGSYIDLSKALLYEHASSHRKIFLRKKVRFPKGKLVGGFLPNKIICIFFHSLLIEYLKSCNDATFLRRSNSLPKNEQVFLPPAVSFKRQRSSSTSASSRSHSPSKSKTYSSTRGKVKKKKKKKHRHSLQDGPASVEEGREDISTQPLHRYMGVRTVTESSCRTFYDKFVSLRQAHDAECEAYRKRPLSYPSYEDEKASFVSRQPIPGRGTETWETFWPKRLEEILSSLWAEKELALIKSMFGTLKTKESQEQWSILLEEANILCSSTTPVESKGSGKLNLSVANEDKEQMGFKLFMAWKRSHHLGLKSEHPEVDLVSSNCPMVFNPSQVDKGILEKARVLSNLLEGCVEMKDDAPSLTEMLRTEETNAFNESCMSKSDSNSDERDNVSVMSASPLAQTHSPDIITIDDSSSEDGLMAFIFHQADQVDRQLCQAATAITDENIDESMLSPVSSDDSLAGPGNAGPCVQPSEEFLLEETAEDGEQVSFALQEPKHGRVTLNSCIRHLKGPNEVEDRTEPILQAMKAYINMAVKNEAELQVTRSNDVRVSTAKDSVVSATEKRKNNVVESTQTSSDTVCPSESPKQTVYQTDSETVLCDVAKCHTAITPVMAGIYCDTLVTPVLDGVQCDASVTLVSDGVKCDASVALVSDGIKCGTSVTPVSDGVIGDASVTPVSDSVKCDASFAPVTDGIKCGTSVTPPVSDGVKGDGSITPVSDDGVRGDASVAHVTDGIKCGTSVTPVSDGVKGDGSVMPVSDGVKGDASVTPVSDSVKGDASVAPVSGDVICGVHRSAENSPTKADPLSSEGGTLANPVVLGNHVSEGLAVTGKNRDSLRGKSIWEEAMRSVESTVTAVLDGAVCPTSKPKKASESKVTDASVSKALLGAQFATVQVKKAASSHTTNTPSLDSDQQSCRKVRKGPATNAPVIQAGTDVASQRAAEKVVPEAMHDENFVFEPETAAVSSSEMKKTGGKGSASGSVGEGEGGLTEKSPKKVIIRIPLPKETVVLQNHPSVDSVWEDKWLESYGDQTADEALPSLHSPSDVDEAETSNISDHLVNDKAPWDSSPIVISVKCPSEPETVTEMLDIKDHLANDHASQSKGSSVASVQRPSDTDQPERLAETSDHTTNDVSQDKSVTVTSFSHPPIADLLKDLNLNVLIQQPEFLKELDELYFDISIQKSANSEDGDVAMNVEKMPLFPSGSPANVTKRDAKKYSICADRSLSEDLSRAVNRPFGRPFNGSLYSVCGIRLREVLMMLNKLTSRLGPVGFSLTELCNRYLASELVAEIIDEEVKDLLQIAYQRLEDLQANKSNPPVFSLVLKEVISSMQSLLQEIEMQVPGLVHRAVNIEEVAKLTMTWDTDRTIKCISDKLMSQGLQNVTKQELFQMYHAVKRAQLHLAS